MTRIALGISYNGSSYHGWQYQGARIETVQGHVQKAIGLVADHPVTVTCAGRTDAGVHATNQVIHFEPAASRESKAWMMGGNAHLPDTISVNWAREVPDSFDARYSATSRRYLYLIVNNKIRSALMPDLVTREGRPLDAQRMHDSAQSLLGENDFSSFRAANCQSRTAMRNIQHINVSRAGEMVIIDVAANAFLHHMVRNIAGVLMDIGSGTETGSWMQELLELRDRTRASITAPPNGLFLVQVDYPDRYGLPHGLQLPHFLGNLPIG